MLWDTHTAAPQVLQPLQQLSATVRRQNCPPAAPSAIRLPRRELPTLSQGQGTERDQRTALQESKVSSLTQRTAVTDLQRGTTPDDSPDLAKHHPVIKESLTWGAQTLSTEFCATAPFQLGVCLLQESRRLLRSSRSWCSTGRESPAAHNLSKLPKRRSHSMN